MAVGATPVVPLVAAAVATPPTSPAGSSPQRGSAEPDAAPTAPQPPPAVALDAPARVSLRLQDGRRAAGWIRSWDHAGLSMTTAADAPLDGAERVDWIDLPAARAFEIRRRLLAATGRADAPLAWAWLGFAMLDRDELTLARRAFRVAIRLEPGAAGLAEHAVALRAEGRPVALAIRLLEPPAGDGHAETTSIATPVPAPQRFQGEPWAAVTPEQARRSTERLKRRAAELLDEAGVSARLTETERFLLLTDLPEAEAKRWASELDRMYAALCRTLEIPQEERLFDGKCVVFIFDDRETFLVFEAAAFGYRATGIGGVCHQRGGDVFVSFAREDDDERFATVLIHETVHGFLYRYRSPAKLPTWANEGLADYVAGTLVPLSAQPGRHWEHAKQFVRDGGDALEVMQQSYAEGTWFTEDSYPVSHMLVRYLVRTDPRGLKRWIDDVKDGAGWEEALAHRMGMTPADLAERFRDATMAESSYGP